jgi:hypothetical protein
MTYNDRPTTREQRNIARAIALIVDDWVQCGYSIEAVERDLLLQMSYPESGLLEEEVLSETASARGLYSDDFPYENEA